MGTTIIFRRGENDPTSGSGLTLAEPAFNTTLKTFHIGLGYGVTAAWVGAPISGLSAEIAAGITYKIPTAAAVKNYIGGLCFGNTGGGTSITQYVASFNGRTGAVQGVSAAVAGTGISVSSATGAVTITNIGVQSFNGLTGAVTGASLGANTFTGLQTLNAGLSASAVYVSTGSTFAGLVTFTNGVSAAGTITLASPNLTGTPTAPTAALGTNTTQIATTAFVQSEIVADTVTAFNGRTGAVQGVSAAVAGTGISVSGATGAVTITNIGVQSFNGNTGAVTGASLGANTFTGLNSFNAGISSFGGTFSGDIVKFLSGLSASFVRVGSLESNGSNPVTLSDYRLRFTVVGFPSPFYTTLQADSTTSADRTITLPDASGTVALTSQLMGAVNGSTAATTAVTSFNGLTGAVQGVSAAVAGTGISVSGATGAVTITNIGVQSFNGLTGAVTGVASIRGLTGTVGITNGNGIGLSVSGQTMTFSNTGVLSIDGSTGAISNVARTNVNNYFSGPQTISSTDPELVLDNTDNGNRTTFFSNSVLFSNIPGSVDQYLYASPTSPPNTITLPDFSTTLAGLAGTQTFTGTNTFSSLANFNAGISAAGGTFSALTRFTAGISASGTTAATFGGTVNMNANTVYQPTLQYYNEPYSQVAISGGGLTLDLSTAQVFGVTMDANINTLTISNTPATANRSIGFTLILTADGTARGVTWGSAVKWANNDPPALTSTNGKRDIFSFMSPDNGTNWFAFIAGLNF